MKTGDADIYRDIEYRYLELFRDCALSREFTPISPKFDNRILFRWTACFPERPAKKEEVLEFLSKFYKNREEIEYIGIKYLVDEECYTLYLNMDGLKYSIWIETDNNLITTLWMKEIFIDTFPNAASDILDSIAHAWKNHNWMDIEDYLDRYFKFEMYGSSEIFGNHILSKRQFLVWISCRFGRLKYMKDVEFDVKAKIGGILLSINNESRFIAMKIVDGKILTAKEIDAPPFYHNK